MSGTQISLPPVGLSSDQQRIFNEIIAFVKDPTGQTLQVDGPAGAGKTRLLSEVARAIDVAKLCAPHGKAASILRRKTGLKASTIHAWLYRLREVGKDAKGRRDLRWDKVHQEGELDHEVVLLDECGLAGRQIVEDILATGAIIVAVGDMSQLGPVNQEAYFTTPDYVLTEIHRQALGSPIIRQAHRVRQGLNYEADGDFRVATRAYDDDVVDADVMLCFTNHRRLSLNARARSLRNIWTPNPQPGEPLMCLRNFGRAGIFRGGIYTLLEPFAAGETTIVIDVDGSSRTIERVKFDGIENDLREMNTNTSFTFGYACTVHSAAGSEWDNVLLFDDFRRPEENERRRWLYTDLTRSSRLITVVKS